MVLITDNKELPDFKHLHSVPSYINMEWFKTLRIVEIESLNQLKRFCAKHTDFKHPRNNASMKIDEWSGTKTWGDYLDLLENGDENVIKSIKADTTKQVANIQKEYNEILTNYRFDVTGQFFDVGLVLSGVPEAWLEPDIQVEEKVKVDILINGSFSASVSQKTVIKNAARIMGIAKVLEDHNVQVAIKVVTSLKEYRQNNETMLTMMDVKNYDEPYNYHKISMVLSPSFLRRAHFKIAEVTAEDLTSGYGTPIHFDNMLSLDDERTIAKFEKEVFK